MSQLKVFSKPDILSYTKVRKFETRLGEEVLVAADAANIQASIEQSPAEYVLLGIPEDIGIRAVQEQAGGETSWLNFLKSFLNIQSNDFLVGTNILALGYFDFSGLSRLIEANAAGREEKLM